MTRAFAAFANSGNRVDPYVILEVKTTDGTVLYQYRNAPPIPVMNRRSLEEMNQMMFEVIQTGTGQRAQLDPRAAGAKTGTSQEWRDAWFVGYTADFVAGVWVGNDDNSSMTKVVGGGIPASIWKNYMLAAHRNIPIHPLPGIDAFGSEDYAEAPPEEDNPWVERGENGRDRRGPRDRGVIEDFFDSLFGDDDTAVPVPPPPPPPRFVPQVAPAPEVAPEPEPVDAPAPPPPPDPADETETAASGDPDPATRQVIPLRRRPPTPQPAPPPEPQGPYRQPEPDPDEQSPF
jgi:penicillin-binding protein 1A